MKKLLFVVLVLAGTVGHVVAQELYVFTEPASNMPTKSIGVRLTNEGMFNNPDFVSRTIPEVMFGFNKNLMAHAQAFLSDMDGKYRLEGGSLYVKYRFLSIDEAQSHFRAAAFGRISTSKRPTYTRDINLEGDNSGVQGGLIFTQLLHKLALSATLGYAHAFKDSESQIAGMPRPNNMLSYSLSSGYLLFPLVYKNYKEPNFNFYFEMLGKTDPSSGQSYLDLAPAVQLILNSRTRIDLGYRFQATGNMVNRYTKNMYLLRAEFNFFNALK
ncbi:hypothetical protein [Pedobacter sp. BMA]|uniref:hypothetical protein n=1 Tax=Pedobacter sp. BMA TaxID=1663685 RepID=UPI00064AD79C|nr:hypothetical protein [Pedobacter sp. BMA]KLT64592.1 hypothetical protein AB669_12565 [Pedobacter sp. BMA]